jgi:two-component system sensor histidine kinase/response regulator
VLDLAKIEAGRFELRPSRVALPDLLRECADWVRAAAADKRVALHVAVSPDLPPSVVADGTRLRQLVLNFLSNAVKFALPAAGWNCAPPSLRPGRCRPGRARAVPDRGARRRARRARKAARGGLRRLRPSSATGRTAPASASPSRRTSPRAWRARSAAARTRKRLRPRTLFWTELPLEPAARRGRAADGHGDGGAAAVGRRALRVLVADDVPANLAVVRALLESAGTRELRERGEEAVAAVAASPDPPFDAVLMDVMMPGLDGREATKRIRALPGPPGGCRWWP